MNVRERSNRRCTQLFNELDMHFNALKNSYLGSEENNNVDFNVHWTEITCDNEDTWNEKISKLKWTYSQRKEKLKTS